MDRRKENALVCWMNSMVHDGDLTAVIEIKNNSTILIDILKKIDPEITYIYDTDYAKNVNFVCQYVQKFFHDDIITEEDILRGNEVEIGKLLCLLLELALTGPNNMESIAKIQSLSEEVQTNIMILTTMVSENSGKINLSEIMINMLRKSVTEESPIKLIYSPASTGKDSPTKSSTLAFCNSPEGKVFNISSENTSPLAAFVSSPQALYRRVMVENTKLKQKVRHSEMFLKKRSQFDEQLAIDAETEHKEVMAENKKLLNEQEKFKERNHDLEETVKKLKDEIEFLQLEVQSKDKEILEQQHEQKNSRENVSHFRMSIDSDLEEKLQRKLVQYDEEVEKTKQLTLQLNLAEQQNTDLKGEYLLIKEKLENLNKELIKKKVDHADQIAHLEEEVRRLEKQHCQNKSTHENLADTLQRDKEIFSLKEQNSKLQLTVSTQETSIVNMGHATKQLQKQMELTKAQIQKEKIKLQEELSACKKELEIEKSKSLDVVDNNKVQTKQYMDQISCLLKQVEEHTTHNKGLSEKINNAETKCKQLETQVGKFEQSEEKIMVQIQQQNRKLQEEKERVKLLQSDILIHKETFDQLKKHTDQLEGSMKILEEESKRLSLADQRCQDVLNEYNTFKETEKQHSDELSKTIRDLKQQLKEQQTIYSELETVCKKTCEEKELSQHKMTTVQAQVANSDVALEESQARIAQLQAERDTLKMQTDNLAKKISELEFSVKELTYENTVSLSSESKQANEIQELKLQLEEDQIAIRRYEETLTCKSTNAVKDDSEELQKYIDSCDYKDNQIKELQAEGEELLEQLTAKDELLTELRNKYNEESITNKRLNTINRSLETQLKCSEAVIRDLKKELNELQSKENSSLRDTSRNQRKTRATNERNELQNDSDGGVLSLVELQTNALTEGGKAEEIFQRSRRSNAHSRDVFVLPTKREEQSPDNEFSAPRTYALRKSERRRSCQPRRYMGGQTPPRRRTLMGDPMQAQMCAFSTETEEEPDLMDDMEWGRIASLKELSSKESEGEDEDRLAELHRRNTLCLPHLKSSYPLESEVSKENVSNDLLSSRNGKRKQNSVDAPRGTFKKWKTDNSLRSSSDLSQMTRTTRSESNVQISKMLPRVEIDKMDVPKNVIAQSLAFEITMEPAKKIKMPRSKASGNLTTTDPPVSSRTRQSPRKVEKALIDPEAVKGNRLKNVKQEMSTTGEGFSRNGSKRSSISRATRRIAANLRGKKAR